MFKLLFPLLKVVKFEKLRLISTFLGNGALEGDSFYSVFLSPVRKINFRCSEFQMLLMCQNSLFKSKLLKLLFLNANFPLESMMSILKNWQFHVKNNNSLNCHFSGNQSESATTAWREQDDSYQFEWRVYHCLARLSSGEQVAGNWYPLFTERRGRERTGIKYPISWAIVAPANKFRWPYLGKPVVNSTLSCITQRTVHSLPSVTKKKGWRSLISKLKIL